MPVTALISPATDGQLTLWPRAVLVPDPGEVGLVLYPLLGEPAGGADIASQRHDAEGAGQIGWGSGAVLFAVGVVNFSLNWRAGVTVSDDAITIHRLRSVAIPWRDVKTIGLARRGHMRRLSVVRQSGRAVVCWVPFAVPLGSSTVLLQSQVDLVQQRWERSAQPNDGYH
jgi:hypothetical protein